MKVSNQQYADALYEAVKEKSQSEVNEILANFVKILAKNNQIKNAENIIGKFKETWSRKEGVIEAEVVSREKLDRELKIEIEKYVSKKYNAEKIKIIEKVDPEIKGGVVIRVRDEVIDGSIKGQLNNLRRKLSA